MLHGVRPEILALSEIPFVKAYTARLLYRAGLRCGARLLPCQRRVWLQQMFGLMQCIFVCVCRPSAQHHCCAIH